METETREVKKSTQDHTVVSGKNRLLTQATILLTQLVTLSSIRYCHMGQFFVIGTWMSFKTIKGPVEDYIIKSELRYYAVIYSEHLRV